MKKNLSSQIIILVMAVFLLANIHSANAYVDTNYWDQQVGTLEQIQNLTSIADVQRRLGLVDNFNRSVGTAQDPQFIRQYEIPLLEQAVKLTGGQAQSVDTDYVRKLAEAQRFIPYIEQTNKEEASKTNNGNCWNGITGGGLDVGNCLKAGASWLGALLVWVFVKITVFANYLFNQAINISVREFNQYADTSGPVGTSWSVIRDLVNMGFIFVLLYIAIGTILELQGIDWRKLVPKLIIVALLVNFSAFFTRVIIDVSNVTANQFYLASALPNPTPPGKTPDVTTALFKNIKVFSKNSLFGLGLTDDKGNKTVEQLQTEVTLDWKQILTGTFGGVALALVASFVLLAGAILFIIRTIRLLFLIILSPFAFFFFILPKTVSYGEKWWKALANEATFAPAFLIMVYVVTQITQTIHSKDDGSVIFFLLIIGLLLGALVVAKALGAAGAGAAMKFAGWGNAALVGTGLGVAKLAGKYAGRGVQAIDQKTGGKIYSDRWSGTNKLLKIANKTKGYVNTALKKAGEVSPSFAGARKQVTEAIKSPLKTSSELLAQATKDYGVGGILGRTKDEEREAAKRAKEDREALREKELRGYAEELKSKTLTKERASEILGKMKSKEISKLDKVALKNPSVIHNYNPEDLKAMNREGVDREVMKEIYANIMLDENHPARNYVIANPFGRRGGIATPPNNTDQTTPDRTPQTNSNSAQSSTPEPIRFAPGRQTPTKPIYKPPIEPQITPTRRLLTNAQRQKLRELGNNDATIDLMTQEEALSIIYGSSSTNT